MQPSDLAAVGVALSSNLHRKDSSKSWSAGIYAFICLAMFCEALLLAALLAWATPRAALQSLPRGLTDTRMAIFYWLYPALLFFFLGTGGAGMLGWMIAGGGYLLIIVIVSIVGQVMVFRAKGKEVQISYRDRVAAMFTFYAKERLPTVDSLLSQRKGEEEYLIRELVQQYGPEPGGQGGSPPSSQQVKPGDPLLDPLLATPQGQVLPRGTPKASDAVKVANPPTSSTAASAPLPVPTTDPDSPFWRRVPEKMSTRQSLFTCAAFLLMIFSFMAIMLLIYLWQIPEYKLVVRTTGAPNGPLALQGEFIPQMTAKAVALMYAWPHFASDLRLAAYVHIVTNFCGDRFRTFIPSSERSVIQTDWIDLYSINMTEYTPPNAVDYESVNAWFIRKLAPGQRPLQFPSDPTVVNSPADSRTLVFTNLSDSRVWVKGGEFNFKELVDNELVDNDAHYWDDGVMVIARLAPQDYHRFHSPVDGVITKIRQVEGTYWSVNADAAQSENYVFYNQRQVMVIDAGPVLGKVGYVAIGATCVGSVLLQNDAGTPLQVGNSVRRGDQLGLMQFGGSTVILLFKKGTFLPYCDLFYSSHAAVETYLRVREAIGTINVNYDFKYCI
jgi:phosphatidylserine decarboxylase precursor